MAQPLGPVTLWSQYLGARLASMVLTQFDAEPNLQTATAIGRMIYRIDRRHRERTIEHLRIAFPEWSDEQIEAVALESFEHFVQLLIEVMHSPRLLSRASWADRLHFQKLAPAIDHLASGKPAILITGHLGNWEVLGYLLSVLGFEVQAIARPLDNRLVNDWLLGIREKRGMKIITKWDATEQMLGVLQRGGALGFIADQNAGAKGLFVPFFGRLASTYKSIALLAITQEVSVICGYARRVGLGFDYELGVTDIIHPHEWADQPDPLYYVSARYNRAMEVMIREAPHQYLWMHRRWKSRPRHEEMGKLAPKGLQERLSALPWLGQDEVDRLLNPVQG